MTKAYVNINGEVRDCEGLTFPESGREFRAAWQLDGDVVEVDMTSAREIWRDKLRQLREPKLAALDTEFMKLLETGGDTSAIVAQKQALRDAPADPAIDAATTPEELSTIFPAGLDE